MSENCRRKVVKEAQGYSCEHCNKSFLSYRPTYMITAKVSDFTDSIYVNFAREHGAALMSKSSHSFITLLTDMTAEEFKEFKETESEERSSGLFRLVVV